MKTLIDELLENGQGVKRKPIKPSMFPTIEQEAGAAAVSAGAAIGTLGYQILKDIAGNKTDISWKLARMRGTKFPNDNATKYKNKGGWKDTTFKVKGSLDAGYIDEISATFEVSFSYNGNSVSNIFVRNTEINDAWQWSLNVNQDIRPLNQVFYVGNQEVAAVDISFNYYFESWARNDTLIIDYRIYGNGYIQRTRHQWS